jgi:hypothetical protein
VTLLGGNVYSLKITHEVRDYPAQKQIEQVVALQSGLHEKTEGFKEAGAEIYTKA